MKGEIREKCKPNLSYSVKGIRRDFVMKKVNGEYCWLSDVMFYISIWFEIKIIEK